MPCTQAVQFRKLLLLPRVQVHLLFLNTTEFSRPLLIILLIRSDFFLSVTLRRAREASVMSNLSERHTSKDFVKVKIESGRS